MKGLAFNEISCRLLFRDVKMKNWRLFARAIQPRSLLHFACNVGDAKVCLFTGCHVRLPHPPLQLCCLSAVRRGSAQEEKQKSRTWPNRCLVFHVRADNRKTLVRGFAQPWVSWHLVRTKSARLFSSQRKLKTDTCHSERLLISVAGCTLMGRVERACGSIPAESSHSSAQSTYCDLTASTAYFSTFSALFSTNAISISEVHRSSLQWAVLLERRCLPLFFLSQLSRLSNLLECWELCVAEYAHTSEITAWAVTFSWTCFSCSLHERRESNLHKLPDSYFVNNLSELYVWTLEMTCCRRNGSEVQTQKDLISRRFVLRQDQSKVHLPPACHTDGARIERSGVFLVSKT